jgi:hypothetical protein
MPKAVRVLIKQILLLHSQCHIEGAEVEVRPFVYKVVVANPVHTVTYTYDEGNDKKLGGLITVEEVVDGDNFTSRTTYDTFGREQKILTPQGFM